MCERSVRIGAICGWCVLVGLISAASAAAAVVVRTSEGEYDTDVTPYLWSVVSVRAGEVANHMWIGQGRASVTIRDDRERFRLGPSGLDFGGEKTAPCVLVRRHAARCPVLPASSADDRWSPSVIVDTSAGNDRLFISARDGGVSPDVFAELGAGDDTGWLGTTGRLSGGPGRDRLTVTRANPAGTTLAGEAGDDILVGASRISGGPGNDVLRGTRFYDDLSPGPGHDLVEGRGGSDMLTYDDPSGVRVDLRRGSAWSPHGSVRFTSITNVTTGEGDDFLLGDAGPNALDGRRGRNLVLAGDGDDTIKNARPGSSCGRGRDTVRVPTFSELEEVTDWNTDEVLSPPVAEALSAPVPYDCELVKLGDYLSVAARPLVTGTRVTFADLDDDFEDGLIWELRAGWGTAGRLLGRRTTRRTGARVTVPLNSAGRTCVSRRDCRAALIVTEPRDVINDDPSTPLPLQLTISAK